MATLASFSPAALASVPDLPALLSRLLASLSPSFVSLADWREAVEAKYAGKAKTTRVRTRQALREVVALAGADATTEALTPELLDRFAEAHPERAAETVNGLLRALRAACNIAVGKGWLAASPFAGWVGWKEPDDEGPRHHSRDAIARVLASLAREARGGDWEAERLHALAAVYAYTGLRRNEALTLRAEDLDFGQGVLYVRRSHGRKLKTRQSAAPVPMPKALAKLLRRWSRRCGSDWLFPGTKRLGPWTGGASGKRACDRLKAAGRACGVEGFTPHSLRHSLATHLSSWWGLEDRQVRAVLRHSPTTSTVNRYLHADVRNLAELVADFDFGRPPRKPKRKR